MSMFWSKVFLQTVLFFSSISFDNAAQDMRIKGGVIVPDFYFGSFSILLNYNDSKLKSSLSFMYIFCVLERWNFIVSIHERKWILPYKFICGGSIITKNLGKK